jgi:hypothetical protein
MTCITVKWARSELAINWLQEDYKIFVGNYVGRNGILEHGP